MAEVDVANLSVVVSANTKALEQGLGRIAAGLDQMAQQSKAAGDRAGAAFERMGRGAEVAAAAVRGVFIGASSAGFSGLTQLVQTTIADLARLGREAEKAGVSSGAFQGFQFALRAQGVEAGKAGDMLAGFASKVRDAEKVEVDLEKTLAANNVAIRDKSGALRPTIDVLADFADMVRNASTREEGLALAAAAFGDAGRDLLPVLERGADGIRGMERAARDAGQVIDAEMIRKARDFDIAWTAAWAGFGIQAKSAVASAADSLSTLFSDAERFLNRIGNAEIWKKLGPSVEAMRAAGVEPVSRQGLADRIVNGGMKSDAGDGLMLTVRPRGPATRIVAPPERGGRAGRDPITEEDRAEKRLEAYVKSLQRTHEVEKARLATFGKSVPEQRAAMEIARAMPDLERVGAEEKQRLTQAISDQVIKIESARESYEKLRREQEAVSEAAKFMGDSLTSALEDAVFNGQKADQVFKNLAKTLASSTLRAALTGEGPLSGLFGTKGVGGAAGGLFGSLFQGVLKGFSFGGARAAGGPVDPGRFFLVGERGPELFVPNTPGRIVPNNAGGGSRSAPIINIAVDGATGDAQIRGMIQAGVAAGMQQVIAGEHGRQMQREARVL